MTLPLPKDRFVAAETFERAESQEGKKEKESEGPVALLLLDRELGLRFAVFAHSKEKRQRLVISMHVNKSPRGSDHMVKSKTRTSNASKVFYQHQDFSLGQDTTLLMHLMMTRHIKSPELK